MTTGDDDGCILAELLSTLSVEDVLNDAVEPETMTRILQFQHLFDMDSDKIKRQQQQEQHHPSFCNLFRVASKVE